MSVNVKFVDWREYADVDEARDGVGELIECVQAEVERALESCPDDLSVMVKFGIQVDVNDPADMVEDDDEDQLDDI